MGQNRTLLGQKRIRVYIYFADTLLVRKIEGLERHVVAVLWERFLIEMDFCLLDIPIRNGLSLVERRLDQGQVSRVQVDSISVLETIIVLLGS